MYDLREGGALGPDAAVLAEDGGGGEGVAFDFVHQLLVHVRLPRHLSFLLYFFDPFSLDKNPFLLDFFFLDWFRWWVLSSSRSCDNKERESSENSTI